MSTLQVKKSKSLSLQNGKLSRQNQTWIIDDNEETPGVVTSSESKHRFNILLDPLNDILNQLSVIVAYIKEKGGEDIIADEWNTLSVMLDRLCMIIYLLLTLVVSLALLLPAAI